MECKWLPDFYDEPVWNDYPAFEEKLYLLFKRLYLENPLTFKELIVRYRFKPFVNNKEEVFYHLTCKDFEKEGDRCPDPNRIVRIKWTRAFIENHICKHDCCTSKPLYWTKTYGNKIRHKIFLKIFW